LDAPGEFDLRACHRDAVEWRAPALDVLAIIRLCQIPELDQAGACVGQRMMYRVADVGRMNAAVDRLLAEALRDQLQDRPRAPEGVGERHRIECETGIGKAPLQITPPLIEFVRRGALEGKDRLLLVADCKDRARRAVARACARGEFGNEMEDDVPLPRA